MNWFALLLPLLKALLEQLLKNRQTGAVTASTPFAEYTAAEIEQAASDLGWKA